MRLRWRGLLSRRRGPKGDAYGSRLRAAARRFLLCGGYFWPKEEGTACFVLPLFLCLCRREGEAFDDACERGLVFLSGVWEAGC